MSLTFRTLLDRSCEMEGTDFADLTEPQKKVRVKHMNAALRWLWKTSDRAFAFPFSVTTGTITVTDGVVPLASLGDKTWCSLWAEDPRPYGATIRRIYATTSQAGPAPVTDEATVFAFYRSAVPQGTYAEDGTYATPSTIPDDFEDIVPVQALRMLYLSLQQWDGVKAVRDTYGDPDESRDRMVAAALNSNLIWNQHVLSLVVA